FELICSSVETHKRFYITIFCLTHFQGIGHTYPKACFLNFKILVCQLYILAFKCIGYSTHLIIQPGLTILTTNLCLLAVVIELLTEGCKGCCFQQSPTISSLENGD